MFKLYYAVFYQWENLEDMYYDQWFCQSNLLFTSALPMGFLLEFHSHKLIVNYSMMIGEICHGSAHQSINAGGGQTNKHKIVKLLYDYFSLVDGGGLQIN